jgi:hypothetical protein
VQRIALPHLVVHVRFQRPPQYFYDFLKVLQNHPALGPQVRSIYIIHIEPSATDAVSSILSRMTSLVQLYDDKDRLIKHEPRYCWAGGMNRSTFELVAPTSGPTLREFSRRITNIPGCEQSPAIFKHLRHFEFLEWKSDTVFDSKDETFICDALPKPMELRIEIDKPCFWTTLARMKCGRLYDWPVPGTDTVLGCHPFASWSLSLSYAQVFSSRRMEQNWLSWTLPTGDSERQS